LFFKCIGEGIRETLKAWQGDDGWNQLGTDGNTGQLSPRPFKDVIGYNAGHVANSGGPGRNWAPLTECSSGFCANQEHVVPHIGLTGRTYFLSQEDRFNIVSGVVKPLIVDYKAELQKIHKVMKDNVITKPLYKAQIAYHDNKFDFAAGTRQLRSRNKNTWEEQIFMQNAFLGVEYEGIVINWQAKVLNDHVRPTTVSHSPMLAVLARETENGMGAQCRQCPKSCLAKRTLVGNLALYCETDKYYRK
jgi:hypothetical protein